MIDQKAINIRTLYLVVLSLMYGAAISYMLSLDVGLTGYLGFFGTLVVFVAIFINYRVFLLFMLALKPLIDLSWDTKIFSFGFRSINLLHVSGLLVFGVTGMVYFYSRRKQSIFNDRVIWAFLLINLFNLFLNVLYEKYSLIYAIEFSVRAFVAYFIYFVFNEFIETQQDKENVVKIIWFSTLFVAVLSVFSYMSGHYRTNISSGVIRYAGLYNDAGTPVYNAIFSLMFGVLFLEMKRLGGRSLSNLYYFLLAGNFLCFFIMLKATVTRSALLLFIMFSFMWWGIYKKRFLTTIAVLALFVAVIMSMGEFRTRFTHEIDFLMAEQKNIESASGIGSGRFATWQRVLNIYWHDYSFSEKLLGSGDSYGAHNQYIAYLMQVGVVGLALFLVLIGRFSLKLYSLYSSDKKAETFFVFTMLQIFIIFGLIGHPFQWTTFLWYLMILLSSINNMDDKANYLKESKRFSSPPIK